MTGRQVRARCGVGGAALVAAERPLRAVGVSPTAVSEFVPQGGAAALRTLGDDRDARRAGRARRDRIARGWLRAGEDDVGDERRDDEVPVVADDEERPLGALAVTGFLTLTILVAWFGMYLLNVARS
jgi:hypothetical protein